MFVNSFIYIDYFFTYPIAYGVVWNDCCAFCVILAPHWLIVLI